MTITITRTNESAEDLRRAARSSRNVAQARRPLAIALVMDGQSRTEAATAAGMNRQTLRDWVHRFNAAGRVGPPGPPAQRTSGSHERRTVEGSRRDRGSSTRRRRRRVLSDGVASTFSGSSRTGSGSRCRSDPSAASCEDAGSGTCRRARNTPRAIRLRRTFLKDVRASVVASVLPRPQQRASLWRSGFRTKLVSARRER